MTLLDVLAGRTMPDAGRLCLGQRADASPADVQRHAAYVQQDDAIMASQTAREALHMSALLTLPQSMPKAEKMSRAEKIIKQFQLESCADTLVGDPVGKVKGLSGGERKRTAVAMAVVREPQIVFLDEPTSGLDAFKAKLLVSVMSDLALNTGATVVFTIHQPSSDIFALFDDLMIMLHGQCVYAGLSSSSVPHFSDAGYPCPQYANPADFFFMHVLTSEDGSSVDDQRTEQLVQAWKAAEQNVETEKKLDTLWSAAASDRRPCATTIMRTNSSFATQFVVLIKRAANDLWRNPMRGKAQIGQSLFLGLILTLIWAPLDNDQNGVQDRVGIIFFLSVNSVMQNVMCVLTTFANERGAVLREQENGMYRTLPYFISRILVDVPLKVLQPILQGIIVYWAVGFQADAMKYLVFQLILILLALASN